MSQTGGGDDLRSLVRRRLADGHVVRVDHSCDAVTQHPQLTKQVDDDEQQSDQRDTVSDALNNDKCY